MLKILSKKFKSANRPTGGTPSDPFMTHEEELHRDEARRREELHRQLDHAKYFRNY